MFNWASKLSPVCLLSHASFNLGYGSWDVVREVFVASRSHEHDIFDSYATDLSLEFPDLIAVKITQIERVEFLRNLSIEKEVAEVATWLNSDAVTFLDDAGRAYVSDARQRASRWRVRQVAAHIVAVETDKVAESVGHKEEANTLFHHLVDVTGETTKLNEAFKDDAFGKLVHIDPVSSGNKLGKDST